MAQNDADRIVRVPLIWVERVRRFLHDFPEINELIDSKERFSDVFLADMIIQAALQYNLIAPNAPELDISLTNLANVTMNIGLLIQDLAVVRALESISIPMQFNQIQVNSGNIQENLNWQWQNLNITIGRMTERAVKAIADLKEYLNTNNGWGWSITEMYYATGFTGATINVPY